MSRNNKTLTSFLKATTPWSGGREQRRNFSYAFDNAYRKRAPETEIEKAVFTALDTAIKENGYTFAKMSAHDIADDLNRYAPDIDVYEPEDVVRAVEVYFAE